ncbi:MAG: alanine--glyoxylate aminotransferase [Sulfobacillus acidophilus]|uniref:Alanine--glyoxylate aminotransferase n=1 Tax=Sulfobacillus acidophilus TaxID=53633 RepID=A0A2T2WDN0_9FIRM|nr:MAG: alanine--glyoxylate aminotransferase [Sulfobacillus acidophilus]
MTGEVVPDRLLLGPGPSPVSDRVRLAMAQPLLGHMDPAFLAIVDNVQAKLRRVFGTANDLTFPVSGTGSAGMEMCLANFVEPGDGVVVIEQGIFGQRMADAARRLRARVISIEVPFGEMCGLDRLVETLEAHPEVKLVAVVKAETSTGVLQPLAGWADEVHRRGALLLVDAVTALGGLPVDVDAMGLDIVFSGTQKCLGAPPGLAPMTAGRKALDRLQQRRDPVPSWYFDLLAISQYLGKTRAYHHTAPVSMIYALDEALTSILEEGLEETWNRHRQVAVSLWAGLEAMGLRLMVPAEYRLPTVATVEIPAGVDEGRVRRQLLSRYGIEIAGGLGPWAGQIWRIGVMGQGAQLSHMMRFLTCLRECLAFEGVSLPSGLAAMEEAYGKWGRD